MNKEIEVKILGFLDDAERSTDEIIKNLKLAGFECNGRSLENLTSLEKQGLVQKRFDPKLKSFVWKLNK